MDLKDVWEDVPALPVPVLKPFQKDFSYGRARGNTWGYRSNGKRERKRLDKFFYTGCIETLPLTEAQDISGRIGRLGIDLKTEVEAWEYKDTKVSVARGRYVEKEINKYYSEDIAAKLRHKARRSDAKGMVRKKIHSWVSDHFGIAVGAWLV